MLSLFPILEWRVSVLVGGQRRSKACAKCLTRKNGTGFTEEGAAYGCKLTFSVRLQQFFLDFLIKTHTILIKSDLAEMAKLFSCGEKESNLTKLIIRHFDCMYLC